MELANSSSQCIINNDHCMSVKSQKEPNIQCPYSKKNGELCGIHSKSKKIIRIDQRTADFANHRIMINVSFRKSHLNPVEEEIHEYYDQLKCLENVPISKLNYAKIIKTLRNFQVQIEGDKQKLVDLLIKTIKGAELINSAYQDPASKCNNTTDFYDFVDLNSIPKEYLFIFICQDGMLYGMDLRSMHTYFQELDKDAMLMEKPVEYRNPYNRCMLSSKTICEYRNRIIKLQENGKDIKYPDEEHNPEDQMTFKVLEVFHTIYNYGYAVDASWFLKMKRQELLDWYWAMEDIWNRRLGLNISTKRNIVPGDLHIFNKAQYYTIRNNDLLELQEFMIDKIDQMVNSGLDRDSRILGIHYVLIGLCEICEIDNSLPFGMGGNIN